METHDELNKAFNLITANPVIVVYNDDYEGLISNPRPPHNELCLDEWNEED
jgi:hypothetical protein